MKVGTNKDHGLYNKPSDVVRPGASAAGTLPQYNTTDSYIHFISTIYYFNNIYKKNDSYMFPST